MNLSQAAALKADFDRDGFVIIRDFATAEDVHPHSDAIDGAVIWIALDETDQHNGCLHFLKGSHKRDAEFAHLRADTPTDLSDHPDLFEAAMSPGDIAIFRSTTVHGSGPNHDGSVRRGFNCFYMGDPWRKGWEKGGAKDWKAAKKAKSQLASQ